MKDALAEFRAAMERAGIVFDAEIITDGRLHRTYAEGDAPGSKNAWYVLHLDAAPMGRFGSWRLAIREGWASSQTQTLSPEELSLQRARIEALQLGREEEREALEACAQERAAYIWDRAAKATDDHGYLQAKGIGAHGLRLWKDSLVVPLLDIGGVIRSLQFISAEGKKRFLSHGRVQGCFCGIGQAQPGARLWLAEGLATGATVYEVMAEPVAIALNSGNLGPVAEALKQRMPEIDLWVAADNDQWTEGNPGLDQGIRAARAVGARVAVPGFCYPVERPTDWNDLRRLRGADETRQRLLRAV